MKRNPALRSGRVGNVMVSMVLRVSGVVSALHCQLAIVTDTAYIFPGMQTKHICFWLAWSFL